MKWYPRDSHECSYSSESNLLWQVKSKALPIPDPCISKITMKAKLEINDHLDQMSTSIILCELCKTVRNRKWKKPPAWDILIVSKLCYTLNIFILVSVFCREIFKYIQPTSIINCRRFIYSENIWWSRKIFYPHVDRYCDSYWHTGAKNSTLISYLLACRRLLQVYCKHI